MPSAPSSPSSVGRRRSSGLPLTMTRSSIVSSGITLETLTLAHILNGETCPPISFPDFAAFVAQKEFTAENLLFVIWYRSFKARYDALRPDQKDGTPIPSTRLGDRYSPFAYLDRAIVDGAVVREDGVDEGRTTVRTDIPRKHVNCDDLFESGCGCSEEQKSKSRKKSTKRSKTKVADVEMEPRVIYHGSSNPPLPPHGTRLTDTASQAFREEAERAFATFLGPNGSKALGVSDDLRQFVSLCLKRSSAPECFLPVYEDIYHAIETQSLPHFLSYAKTNINRPKQLFWYMVGLVDMLIGVLLFLLPTLLVPQRNYGYRLTRLPSVLFGSFGAMQFYSAALGFCTQVWGRASRQVRPWELDPIDESRDGGAGVDDNSGLARAGAVPGLDGGPTSHSLDLRVSNDSPSLHADLEKHQDMPELFDLQGHLPTSIDGSDPTRDTSSECSSPHMNRKESEITITEIHSKQLAIRRATIKAPPPELAFPIVESEADEWMPKTPKTPTPDMPISSAERNEISPFAAFSDELMWSSGPRQRNASTIRRASIGPDDEEAAAESPLSTPGMGKRAVGGSGSISGPSDLNRLVNKWNAAGPQDDVQWKARVKEMEKKTKMFGPEKLVQDPSVKAAHSRVIRDILILGGVVGVVMLVLCFAAPMRL